MTQYISDPSYSSRNLSNNYRRRLESYLRRNPGASVTEARGHRASQSERAVRLRQTPEERYTPEYLAGLSPSWRNQIQKELRESQQEQRSFEMPGTLKKKAFKLYTTHLDMLGITIDSINTTSGMTFREDFTNTWSKTKTREQRNAFIFFISAAIQNSIDWKTTHDHEPDIDEIISDPGLVGADFPTTINDIDYDPDDFIYEPPDEYDLNDIALILPPSVRWYHAI